jgi:hypothetical protein
MEKRKETSSKKGTPTMPKRPYPSHQRRHDVILLAIFENPMQTQKQIAKTTGYSPSQVSRILCSPDFEERYEQVFRKISAVGRCKWLASLGSHPKILRILEL